MAGYTVIKSAAEQMMERDNQADFLEVLDIDTMQKTTVSAAPGTAKPKKARKKPQKDIVVEEVAEGVVEIQEPEQQFQEPQLQADKEVVFVTPYTEVTVGCYEVHVDQTVFSVITPTDDRVKVKPKRGAKLSAVYQGLSYDLYASGIYLPVDALKATVSIFFVVDETTEEE